MSKITTLLDHSQLIPQKGRWTWNPGKDGENPSLEFISNNPGADRQDRKRDKRQKGGIHFQDHNGGRRADKRAITPSVANRAYGVARGQQSRMAGPKSPTNRQGGKQSLENACVSLEDVKGVAYDKTLSELEDIPKDFDSMFATGQFDEFMMCMLNYFHSFFEKRTHEQKPNPMNIEPSLADKQYYADLSMKLEIAQKILGQSYCVLVLGIGLDHNHHMNCGMSRVSKTYRDRDMYETLYHFCSFVVWITFRRKDYDVVKKELNRMLRSDTFNPAIRVKNAPDTDSTDEEGKVKSEGDKTEEIKLTPAEYRRIHGKRPAIKSIINQRSPALISILPSPKEEAHWLFKKQVLSSRGLESTDAEESLQEHISKLNLDPKEYKMGIIGEPLSHYNPLTLAPQGTENEDEENEDDDDHVKDTSGGQRGPMHSNTHGKMATTQEKGMSRQPTAISQATTEALSDDD